MKKSFFMPMAILLGVCLPLALSAQTARSASPKDKPPLPEGALLRPLGPKEAWSIQFDYGSQSRRSSTTAAAVRGEEGARNVFSESSPPSMVAFTRLEPFLMVRFVGDRPGEVIEYYESDVGNLFYVDKSSRDSVVRELPPNPADWESPPMILQLYFALKRGSFFGFDWIGANNYIGVEEINGIPCMVFEKGDRKAWVDLEKRQPVLWQEGEELRRFTPTPVPPSIDFPQQVKEHIRAYKELSDNLRKPPPRGG